MGKVKVFIIAAMSADGFIGQNSSQTSLDWRSREDGKMFAVLTKRAGVIVMGSATYKTFRMKRAPPGRRLIVYSHHPEDITGENVETTMEDAAELIERLSQEGHEEVAIGGGAMINKLFLDAGLVGELYLSIEPILFGGGVPLFNGPLRTALLLLDINKLNDNTVLLHYKVENRKA